METTDPYEAILKTAIKMAPNNFTSLAKTPWGGTKIANKFKKAILPQMGDQHIGESWEFSCDPAMPSQLADLGLSLPELIKRYPNEILSSSLLKKNQEPHYEILVKLLDAKHPLSFQVHPDDHNPLLGPNECGKPESWLVLEAEKDAGIFLGFKNGVRKEDLLKALSSRQDLSPLMQFVPVKPNDYFEIAPGVPHAIGGGVTLLEPQRISSSRSGKTYRLWDWNRCYNEQGQFDEEKGKERELHIDACLDLITPESQSGEGFLNSLKVEGSWSTSVPGARILSFPKNPYYQTQRVYLDGRKALSCSYKQGYGIIFVIEGKLSIQSKFSLEVTARQGQSLLLPFYSNPYKLFAAQACNFAFFSPAIAEIAWT
ncbi:MAG: class I mannose-6-phosphate isomerase [Oligoflexales bacterium]|nr:class I mannose-6-phosphate isomerase [Oligoflexales bacterium]